MAGYGCKADRGGQVVEKGSPAPLGLIAWLQRSNNYASAEPVLSEAEGSISRAPGI